MADDQRAALYRATVQKQGATRFDIQRTAEREYAPLVKGGKSRSLYFQSARSNDYRPAYCKRAELGLNFQYRARVI
jgi:hypothetical protein